MKKNHILLAIIILVCLPVSAIKRRRVQAPKTPVVPATELAQKALDIYDVESARSILEKELAALSKKKQPTQKIENLLEQTQQIALKLHATEHIVIIDSLVCKKEDALKAILLSKESGRIDTYASTYHTTDKNGATLYENELANKRYLAVPKGRNGSLRLATTDKLGEKWSEPHLLSGLPVNDLAQNFPFLLSDGVTLYYAATGPESLGGYDIFVTRTDGDEGQVLTPENIGFPFNSPANDYLLAIDELNQLGWFISDRRQPRGKVCVYTFIPNATREVYGSELSEKQLAARARITAIRDTWNKDAKEAQQRLHALRTNKSTEQQHEQVDFQFFIDETRTYTRLTDFRSAKANQKMQQWLRLSKDTQTDAILLQRLRDNYATSDPVQRKKMAQTILQLEATHYPQMQKLQQLAIEIRNLEISFK